MVSVQIHDDNLFSFLALFFQTWGHELSFTEIIPGSRKTCPYVFI